MYCLLVLAYKWFELTKMNVIIPHITLQSSDGEIFNITAEIAKKSAFLEVKLERWMNVSDGGENVPTHLPINAAILKR